MHSTIGEVAELLGITPGTIRYYEQEGLIEPDKDAKNDYRLYSYNDIFILSVILFYRDLEMPLGEIKRIFRGVHLEEEMRLIEGKKAAIALKIKHYQELLQKMEYWEEFHREGLNFLESFDIRPMPPALRKAGAVHKTNLKMDDFKSSISIRREFAFFVTFSFHYNILHPQQGLHHYMSLDAGAMARLDFKFTDAEAYEEKADRCLYTELQYNEDVIKMLAPVCRYAAQQGLELSGDVYGRLNMSYHDIDRQEEFFRVYALLKD